MTSLIRSIWEINENPPAVSATEVTQLFNLEKLARDDAGVFLDLAKTFFDDVETSSLDSLHVSCKVDLVAGCELARTGYFKQAYALWRAWFEQSLFALYFLEAPIHRFAWKTTAEVSMDDSPNYRLMLHQLLAESSERHPFALVYDDRYMRLLNELKIDLKSIKKERRPIRIATRVLTTLSQGVHGTYQPKPPRNEQDVYSLLEKHCLQILEKAVDTVALYWLLFLTANIGLPPDVLIALRDGILTDAQATATDLPGAEKLMQLAPIFKRSIGSAVNG